MNNPITIARFVSGLGQHHTNDADPNNSNKKLTPYLEIGLAGIRALVDNPQQVDKTQAQWFIPSTLKSRNFKEQQAQGEYWMLWADFDKNPKLLKELNDLVSAWGFDYEIYSSRSATIDNQKGRILIPLNKPLSGADWVICQKLLNDIFEAHGFTPDRASERAAQLCYLPNAGDFYERYPKRNDVYFDVINAWALNIKSHKDELIKQTLALDELKKESAARKAALKLTDKPDLISSFNQYFTVQDVLLKAGYVLRGDTFRHPNSESGSYSASVRDNRVHTLSSNDPLYSNGNGAHDAFSAFTVLFAGGDRNQALKLAGDELVKIAGVPFNQAIRNLDLAKARTQSSVPYFDANNTTTTFQLVSASELTAKQTHTEWLVKGLIGSNNMGLVFGQSGHGKSFFVLDMAFCIATGIEFFGHKVTQGSVVYIAGEGYSGLTKRMKALEIKYNTQAPKLFLSKTAAALTDVASSIEVRQAIDAICSDAALVIIDTLHRNFGAGDENSATDFGAFCSNVDSYIRKNGESVLIVHHSGHTDAERSRGSSSIKAAMDFEYRVTKLNNLLTVTNTKMKDDEPPEDLRFEMTQQPIGWLDDDGKEFTSLVLYKTYEKSNIRNQLTKAEKTGMESFKNAANESYQDSGVHLEDWRAKFYEISTADSPEAKRQAFNRVRNSLVNKGCLTIVNDFYDFAGEFATDRAFYRFRDKRDIAVTSHAVATVLP